LFAGIEPFIRWIGTRLSGLVPDALYRSIDRQLVLSGDYLGLNPDEYIAMTIVGAFAGIAAGFVSLEGGSPVPCIILGVSGALATYILVGREIERRARDLARGLPYVIDLLALGMSAGLDFPGAVRTIVDRSSDRTDALTEELERLLQAMSLGRTRREVLLDLAERTNVTSVIEFVSAVVQAEQRGSPLADTLMIQAQVSRQRRTMRAEEGAARSATLIYLPLGFLMITVLILVGGPIICKLNAQIGL
jgi:tight adherence protein C